MKLSFKGILCAAALLGSVAANAKPQLRITASAVGPVVIQQGQNGPVQTIEAANIGDGSLSLIAASSASWLSATVGASTSCRLYGSCLPVNISLSTASLASGVYTGTITLNDSNAVDAPQTVSVTVQIGTNVPDNLAFYAAPGGSATSSFNAASAIKAVSSASWLSVALSGQGTYGFSVPYQVTAKATGLAANDYNGTIAVSGSSLASDNKTVAVVLHVTSSPIAQPAPSSLNFRLAADSISQTQAINVVNAGQGTLQVGEVTAAASSGTWLTASVDGNVISVTASSTGVAPGNYSGTVTVASNAANNSITIPVSFQVDTAGPAAASFEAAVNNATFIAGETVAPGDIMAVFGQQLFFSGPVLASNVPLPTTLSGVNGSTSTTQVLVNGQAAPLYYASYNQINFQLPFETQPGQAVVQIVRDGTPGNSISVQVVAAQPRVLPFSYGNYGIVQNATQGGFAISSDAGAALGGVVAHPAKAGKDYLTIYAIGLGPVAPTVPTGTAALGDPKLSHTTLATKVSFISGNPLGPKSVANASFSGLAPGFVGLYQVNVQVPAGAPKGNSIGMMLTTGAVSSNVVNIAIE